MVEGKGWPGGRRGRRGNWKEEEEMTGLKETRQSVVFDEDVRVCKTRGRKERGRGRQGAKERGMDGGLVEGGERRAFTTE